MVKAFRTGFPEFSVVEMFFYLVSYKQVCLLKMTVSPAEYYAGVLHIVSINVKGSV